MADVLIIPARLVATPGVLSSMTEQEIMNSVNRHCQGDWGVVCDEDKATNDRSYLDKGMVMSVFYTISKGIKHYVITDPGHATTTVLLPSEY